MKRLAHDHDLTHLFGALERIPTDRRRLAVDGGAHTGGWTAVLSAHFARVVAFEPDVSAAREIPDLDHVTVHTYALGDHPEQAGLAEGPDNAGQTHVVPGTGIWIVPLDAFGLEALDFLKLDVEGFEQPALQGAQETIDRCRPWVMIEETGLASEHYGFDDDGARKRLRQWGYREVDRWNKDHLYAP